jgi:amino acid adenylation domain-containing protein/non-ribosomal peptide synthase protein (TIGR01720 family)
VNNQIKPIAAYWDELKAKGIYLYLKGGNLKLKTHLKTVPEDVLEQIKARKQDIIRYIRQNQMKQGPLSGVQQRLWFVDHYEGQAKTAAYNICGLIEIQGALDIAKLQQAFAHVYRRHDILRSRFAQLDNQLVQQVDQNISFELTLHQLSDAAQAVTQADVERLLDKEIHSGFDLAKDCLIRASLVAVNDNQHWLYLAMHHIISDGWTVEVLLKEVFALYRADNADDEQCLAPVPMQYLDYVAWQQQQNQSPQIQQQLDYWQQQLAGFEPFELPGDYARARVKDYQGDELCFTLDPQIAKDYLAFCKAQMLSPFMGGLSLFYLLLFRYSGKQDIAVAVPVANRPQPAFETMLGCFVNTLIMRQQLTPSMTFAELAKSTKGLILDALENQEAPLDKVVDSLNLSKDSGQTEVFNILFNYENLEKLSFDVDGITTDAKLVSNHTSMLDMTFNLRTDADGLQGSIEYATGLFDHATMVNFVADFERLMAAVTVAGDCPVNKIDFAGAVAKPAVQAPKIKESPSVVVLFEHICRMAPMLPAVKFQDQTVSYEQLAQRVDQLALQLHQVGQPAGSVVAVLQPRSIDWVVSVLAVLKAGLAYLPLDIAAQDDVLLDLLKQSQVNKVLSHVGNQRQELLARFAQDGGVVLEFEPDSDGTEQPMPSLPIDGNDLACVLHGEHLTHQQLGRYIATINRHLMTDTGTVSALTTNMADEAQLASLFGVLASGGCVMIADEQAMSSASQLAQWMSQSQVNLLQMPPSLTAVLLPLLDKRQPVKQWLVGGERLTPTLCRKMTAKWPDSKIFNHFAKANTGLIVCLNEVEQAQLDSRTASLPIATADGFDEYAVLSQAQMPMPVGMPGELYVSDYANRGELIRTGDWARCSARGELEYLGKAEEQVHIGGYRADLKVIESAILGLDGVFDCAVINSQPDSQPAQLVAFVVQRQIGKTDQVAQQLAALLPSHMVPGEFIAIESMPLNTAGERDVKALRELQQLAGKDKAQTLISDHARRPGQPVRKEQHSFELDVSLSEQLHGIANSQHCSMSSVMLGAYYVALSVLSGEDDVVVGILSTGLHATASSSVLGGFVSQRAISMAVNSNDSVCWLIKQMDQQLKRSATNASQAAVCQLTFELVNGRDGTTQALNQSDLSLQVFDGPAHIGANIEFDANLFALQSITRLSDIYQQVLVAFGTNQQQQLAQIDLLGAAQRQMLLQDWNKTDLGASTDITLVELFESQVVVTPDNVALIGHDADGSEIQLTYRQLNERANQLAHVIRDSYRRRFGQPMAAGTLVALYLDRNVEMIISLLAVLKAGGAYVPVSTEYPTARTGFIFEDTATALVLTQTRHLRYLDELTSGLGNSPMLLAVNESSLTRDALISNPQVTNSAKDLAYVIYTSGTTGQPKGVMLAQGVFAAFIINNRQCLANEQVSVLSLTQFTFDIFGLEYATPLVTGGTLVLSHIDRAAADLKAYAPQINFIQQTPSMWQAMLANVTDTTGLDHIEVMVGGESGAPALFEQLSDTFHRVHQVYGPTETCIWSTHGLYQTGSEKIIGKPYQGESVYVLDKAGSPVPVGAPGELHIGGVGLAQGYLNRPQLTQERFIDNPFGEPGSRLYKTGDLVRWLADGTLEYIGRNDFQVKIRGFRIELEEIERVIGQQPGIKQAVVVDRKRGDNQYLAAYVIGTTGAVVDSAGLKAAMADKLPAYMVPDTLTQLETMPMSVNGKLDRKALPEPEFDSADNYVAPRNESEQQMCAIWQTVLNVSQVGINDNFFALGGNSILAIRLTAAIGRDMALDISLSQLFDRPTIAGLMSDSGQTDTVVIPHVETERYPLSFAQERLWFVERFEEGTDAYNIPYLVALKDDVDLQALLGAFNRVVDRHPVLKTVYRSDPANEGVDYQHVLDSQIEMQYQLLDSEQDLLTCVRADIGQPFDLSAAPSIRLHHYEQNEAGYLLIVWHHIAFDGWSIDPFISELAQVYDALCQGVEANLPALDINYGDYALWQREYLQGDNLKSLLDYWQQQLDGFETLQLPTDRPRPQHMDYRGGEHYFNLDAGLSAQLRELAREQETTLYTVLLSGFYVAMAALSGQTDIVIGTPSDNRHHGQTQGLVGFFINSLVLRSQVNPEQNVQDYIKQVHQVVTQAKLHQELPFEKLVTAMDIDRDASRHSIYQVKFSVQRFGDESVSQSGLPFETVQTGRPGGGQTLITPAKYDLMMFMDDSDKQIKAEFTYAMSLFDEATVVRMADIYRQVLAEFVANQQANIGSLEVLPQHERHTLVHSWNQTESEYAKEKTLAQLFEEQVEQYPDEFALSFDGELFSYEEVNEEANKLAHVIRQQYVERTGEQLQSDTLIGLYFDRSMEMIISILAVLKAGGAYVPVSPEYPKERTLFILEDTAAPMMLIQQRHVGTMTDWCGELAQQPALIVADDPKVTKGVSDENLTPVSTPTDLAYVIYTSGTTGKPKGVMIEQHCVINHLHGIDTRLGKVFKRTDFSTNYCFDLSVTTYLFPLLIGGCVYIYDGDILDMESYLRHLKNNEIGFLKTTQSIGALIESKEHRIDTVLMGGERLTESCVSRLSNYVDNIFNEYGPTEATIGSTVAHIKSADETHIGNGFPNVLLYVLNEQMQLVPIGSPGELYIGGAGVARGYFNRPDLTAERFVDNPFATAQGMAKGYTKLYKSGDLVRWLADGNIEFIRRNDTQVKIRGYRIELGEIENALLALPQVKQAVVIDREQHGGNQYLAAYLVAEDGQTLNINDIRAELETTMPQYMVPATFSEIDVVPLTVNGKLDRRALMAPQLVETDSYVAPRTKLEEQLCTVWQGVLNRERVGIEDNFFRIGGDSIVCIQLVSRLRKLGWQLQIKAVFDAPTVAQLAKLLAQTQDDVVQTHSEQGLLTGEFDLLPIQQAFFNKPLQQRDHWNQAFMLQIPGAVNPADIQPALALLAARHDMLRCRFVGDDKGYRQQYLDEGATTMAPMRSLDVAGVDKAALAQTLTQWQGEFDICHGSLWQVAHLHGYADGSARLFFAFHHLIVDAVSWRIIADDIKALLTGQTLADKTASYRQWVGAVGQYAEKPGVKSEVTYWQSVVEGYRKDTALEPVQHYQVALNAAQTDILLHQANQGYHTEINDLLLSALALALNETKGHQFNHIVLEGHGREPLDAALDTSQTVGWFTTTYPVKLMTAQDVGETIIQTKEMLRAIPNKGIGFGALSQAGLIDGQLPDVSFNYLGQFDGTDNDKSGDWQFAHEDCGQVIGAANDTPLSLNINGAVVNGRLQFEVDSRLGAVQGQLFADRLTASLDAVITQAQLMAAQGGTKTPSDYGVEALSVDALRRLQSNFAKPADDGASTKRQNKNTLRI